MAFADLTALAAHLRAELQNKKFILLYAYNGTGKTRLSTSFKDLGKRPASEPLTTQAREVLEAETGERGEVEIGQGDTLYFNAFTEDLFSWDNDLANDRERVLKINKNSAFFAGLAELEMDNRIRPLLSRYADFDFRIDTTEWEVSFSREVTTGAGEGASATTVDDIKVSRGEENIFVWCFFLAIVQLAMDDDGTGPYRWVQHIYIDDPISSLDEHNAITVANHVAQLLKREKSRLKTVISTHHPLFFNVLCNELQRAKKYFLNRTASSGSYELRETGQTPFFHHVAALAELYKADREGRLFTHHFNMLRSIMEKTASFHGHENFSSCMRRDDDDQDAVLHTRLVNIMSHGSYSLYEPQEMLEENKRYFRKILHEFVARYPFNPSLFTTQTPPADPTP